MVRMNRLSGAGSSDWLGSGIVITLSGSAGSLALLALANVLIARMIGPTGVGLVATATIVPMIVAYLGELGLPAATGYLINASDHPRKMTVGVARSCVLGLSLGLIPGSLLLTSSTSIDTDVKRLSFVFSLFILMSLFHRVHMAVLQADLRMNAFNAVRVGGCFAYVGVLVALYFGGGSDPLRVILARLFGNVVWSLGSGAIAFSRPFIAYNAKVAKSLLSYGARVHLGTVSAIDGLRLDQLILALFLPPRELGLYVVVMTVVTSNRMIGTSIGMVCFPVATRIGRTGSDAAFTQFRKLMLLALALSVLVAGPEVVASTQLLDAVFGKAFAAGGPALQVLAVASVFMNLRQVAAEWLRGIGRPGIVALTELGSFVVLAGSARAMWNGTIMPVAWAVTIAAAFALLTLGFSALHRRNRSSTSPSEFVDAEYGASDR